MRPTKEEIEALPAVKQFVADHFPGCIVVVHASVFWDDPVFVPLSETDAMRLGIANNKCVRGELTPDYTVFSADDVVCAYEKKRGRKIPNLRLTKDSPDFQRMIDYDKHIPYVATDVDGFQVGRGRVTIIAVRPGTMAKAVIDHKGGTKDFNSSTSRARAILQGRRFGTQDVFMVVKADAAVDERLRPRAESVCSCKGHRVFRLNVADAP